MRKTTTVKRTFIHPLFVKCFFIAFYCLGVVMSSFAQDQTISVKGKVTDEDGAPLPGVSVVIKGTNKGASTDMDGNYTIKVSSSSTLHFSFISFKTVEEKVGGRTTIDLIMKQASTGLDEVVVIGYGSQVKSDLTGAVAQVKLENMKDRPVRDVVEAMQGNIAGVTVVNNGGAPDSEPTIRIRGIGTLSNESPLWVIDGTISTGPPVNPSDIEAITVLKDASAAAIYGSRAAAGVVLVTTKKGKKGKPVISINSYRGTQRAYNLPESLNSAEMADAYNLAADNAGMSRLAVFDETQNPDARVTRTNWMDEIFRTGIVQRYDVGISGGSDKGTYLVSAGYFKNDGIMLNTFRKNYSFRINTQMNITDKLTFGENVAISSSASQSGGNQGLYYGSIFTALAYPPSAKVWYDEANGVYGGVTDPGSAWTGSYGDLVNPVAQLERLDDKTNELRVNGNIFLEYEIIKGLTFKSNFGLNYNTATNKNFQVRRTEPGKVFDFNELSYTNDINLSWVAEQTLNYKVKIKGVHDITVLAGYTAQENVTKGFYAAARDFQDESPQYRFFANAGAFTIQPTDYQEENSVVSYLGRVAYAYKDKYLLTANVRADATSKLAKKNRLGVFPAVSAAWRVSQEKFFADVPYVHDLKVRASWGQIGNTGALGNYATNVNLSKATAWLGSNPSYRTGYALDGISNPDLKWETTTQKDIGIDLSLLNNKIDVTFDYFDKQTDDMLMQLSISSLAGVSNAPWGNVGSVKNKGFELAVNYRENKGDFSYTVGANIASIKNEVLSLGEETFLNHDDSARGVLKPLRTQVGNPLYSFFVYKTAGIFQNEAEVQAHAKDGKLLQANAKPGDLKFEDLNNDGVINEEDKYVAGDAMPDFTFGINGSFQYKNWDLTIFIQGATGVELFNSLKYTAYKPTQGYNLDKRVLNAWSPENTGSDIPRLSLSDENNNFGTASDWYVEDASYLRIKNLTIGYSFSEGLIKKIGLTSLRLYVSSQNLLTLTKYTGIDPEVSGNGIDQGLYPQSKSFTVGVSLKL